ncbi:MAG: hypothetical protein Q7R52_00815 [archaeon]|nr:hypothetical protein [archaeon]
MKNNLGGYLFMDGKWIDFEEIMLNKIDFRRETGALRIRVTDNEINIDFLEEKEPTKQQLKKIEELKLSNKKLVFEIIDKNNQPIKGYGKFDKTISKMKQQLKDFYNKK